MNTEENKSARTVHNLIVLDESGSMRSVRHQALDGAGETVSTIRNAQSEHPEQQHRLTLVTFSSIRESHIQTIFDDLPIDDVRDLTEDDYTPLGGTPLYDAIGHSLNRLEDSCRPEDLVLVTIITDGLENSSHEYSFKDVRELVRRLRDKGWTIAYMGANQDALEVATELNIGNAMNFRSDAQGVRDAFHRFSCCCIDYYGRLAEDGVHDDFFRKAND